MPGVACEPHASKTKRLEMRGTVKKTSFVSDGKIVCRLRSVRWQCELEFEEEAVVDGKQPEIASFNDGRLLNHAVGYA